MDICTHKRIHSELHKHFFGGCPYLQLSLNDIAFLTNYLQILLMGGREYFFFLFACAHTEFHFFFSELLFLNLQASSILFSLLCPAVKGEWKSGLVGTRHPAKVDQPHSLTPRYHYYWYYCSLYQGRIQETSGTDQNIFVGDLLKHNWKYYHLLYGHMHWTHRFGYSF